MFTTSFHQWIQGKQHFDMWEISSEDDPRTQTPDAFCLYHTAELHISNLGSLMPYGNANSIVQQMYHRLPVREWELPVFAGICGTDPFCLLDPLLKELICSGIYGVQNFPTVGLSDGVFRYNLEAISLGFRREVEMMKTARQMGLETFPFVFNQVEALTMAEAEPAAMIYHLGVLQRFLTEGLASSAEPYLERIRSVSALLRKEYPHIKLFVYARAERLSHIIEEAMICGRVDIDGIYTSRRVRREERQT